MHNRFHYKCCDKDTGISIEEVKQQSLKNAQKSRKSRSRTNLNSISSTSNTELNISSPEKESEPVNISKYQSLLINRLNFYSVSRFICIVFRNLFHRFQ